MAYDPIEPSSAEILFSVQFGWEFQRFYLA